MRVAFSLLLLPSVVSVVRNTTVYRITPRNYSGITNLDTGDAAGDAFFGLYEKSAAVLSRSLIQPMAILIALFSHMIKSK